MLCSACTRPVEMLVKICGLTQLEDALFAERAGADYLGIVLSEQSKRRATQSQASAILERILAKRVYLVFGYDSVEYICGTFSALAKKSTAIQVMADHPHIDTLLALQAPQLTLPSIAAGDTVTAAELDRWKDYPLVLFDSHKKLSTSQEATHHLAGGSGKAFDYTHIAGIERPFLLAGGLTPENVNAAVGAAHPAGVDAASGTETRPGIKDLDAVRRFIENAKQASEA